MSVYKTNHNSSTTPLHNSIRDVIHANASSRRSATPNGLPVPANAARLLNTIEGDLGAEEDPRLSVFRDLYAKSEARLNSLFEEKEGIQNGKISGADHQQNQEHNGFGPVDQMPSQYVTPLKRAARTIDEDDYDESDDEEIDNTADNSPLKSKSTLPPVNLALSSATMFRGLSSSSTPASAKGAPASTAGKTTEEARKKLEEDKKATEDAAKRSFHTLFYTLENDRDAMLEQKKLEESENQVDAEMGNLAGGSNADGSSHGSAQHGTLSQINLGASSLTLKNLIRQIDTFRPRVNASDAEIRALVSEVRKNRSKWADADKIGQEELYEASEKVLNELRGMTEYSSPFLLRVNKKDAPDYSSIIKTPMDLGTMQKKIKAFAYKSKAEFVDDLNLIWANCLRYNQSHDHPLRKKALFMRKETEKLVALIPNISVKDRAAVEAEERRQHNGISNFNDEEDSDDEPIISSRGRKAPSKTSKKGTTARKAPAGASEESPVPPETKPSTHLANGLGSNLKNESLLRADSESIMDGSQKETPPRSLTPAGVNGILHATQSDNMDIDGESSINGVIPSVDVPNEEADDDDLEYKIWKQVTKRDRALITAERHALFQGNRINEERPSLRRSKQGMRRWLKNQKQAVNDGAPGKKDVEADLIETRDSQPTGETLAEGMEGEEEKVVPDYYDTMAAMPNLSDRLRWVEDSEGQLQDPSDEFLRLVPTGFFTSPESNLTRKVAENMRQIQDTRKITSKIGIVKQMQIQSQMYQGQFQKHEPAPFVEQDIEPHVLSDDGPPIAPRVCRAALQRSAAKLLVHAGFEEFQPSALDAITDLAGDYFTKLATTLNEYSQAPQVAALVPGSQASDMPFKYMFTTEETILHTLQENGIDLEGLDSYVTEDVERAGSKIAMTHDRMKAYLADSLRPALVDAGPDGANAFNDDSEQFVGGDFAEELGEDFFGFKNLGIDIGMMSVPLHLLQNRMRNANQAQNPSALSSAPLSDLPVPAPLTPITIDTVKQQIGLVQNFFLAKLHANNDEPLVEDDDLPQKQRFPKPRLPPTGKITSPRKRPPKEPGPGKGHPRKKMKTNEGEAKETGKWNEPPKDSETSKGAEKDKGSGAGIAETVKPVLTNSVVAADIADSDKRNEKMGTPTPTPTPKGKGKMVNENENDGGLISPESLEAP